MPGHIPAYRTNREAHLYVQLRPCTQCPATSSRCKSNGTVYLDDGDMGARYTGTCESCGATRDHVVRLPPMQANAAATGVYGGDQPSELIDPGEWLWWAERLMATVPLEGPFDAPAKQSLALALASIDEVLKFIPSGEQRVPRSAFTSDRGTKTFSENPGRFTRAWLENTRTQYATREHPAPAAPERSGRRGLRGLFS